VSSSPVAATARTSLDLLALPYPFSQVGLLTAEEIVTAADERRLRMAGGRHLDLSGLEELHRHSILVPMFCVRLGSGDPQRAIDTAGNLTRKHVAATIVWELFAAADEGRVTDPSAETFLEWPTERLRATWPSCARGYLYSQHQLLSLARARSFVAALVPVEGSHGRTVARLEPAHAPHERARRALADLRSLAITLSAIDTRVWPYISQSISYDFEAWRSTNLSQQPSALLDWLGVTAGDLRERSLDLRGAAGSIDVLGDFYDLVRRANPKAWTTLRGDARIAMDSRVAAEALDRFADQLADGEQTRAAMPQVFLAQQGLGVREPSLDAVLTDLHISPHPPLVIAVEGATEMDILPRVMALMGVDLDPRWMRLVDFGGVDANLALLAQYAAAPVLGTDWGDSVALDRPVTRFLVLTDGEGKYTTRADRSKQRKLLLDAIAAPLPADLRQDLYTRSARFVEIVTWGRYPFEFAHFSDTRLADALLEVAGKPHPAGRAALIADVHKQRTLDPTPDIEDVWKQSRVSKRDLVPCLLPLLEARIERAIATGTKGPPVMNAVTRARELANLSYRGHVVLRRHGPPPAQSQ
jgi:hypothetical protein